MRTVAKRVLASIVPVVLAVYAVVFAPFWIFLLVLELFVLAGTYEFMQLIEKKGIQIHGGLALFFAALLPLAEIWSSGFFILAMACLALFVIDFRKSSSKPVLISTALTLFGIIYVAWFFSHLVKIKLLLPYGSAWAGYVLLIVKGGDMAAYFTGSRWGKTKLIEHVSPKKSVEGAFGGLGVSVALSLLSKVYLPYVPMIHLLLLGILVGVIAQLSDLVESFIKRDVGVKDSGQIPGLGGVLDILDSLLLTIPFVYYYARTFLI